MSSRGGPAAGLDLAIDDLLADRPRPVDVETSELLSTARLLRDSLPRYHPRFGFDEHLARRLAAAGRPQAATGLDGSTAPAAQPAPIIPMPGAVSAEPPLPHRRRLGLLASGAIASGVSLAIPIAGAALVAWRRGRTAGGSL